MSLQVDWRLAHWRKHQPGAGRRASPDEACRVACADANPPSEEGQRYARRVSRVLAMCALVALALVPLACAPAQHQASLTGPGEPTSLGGGWPFEPVEIRVHPLTRTVRLGDGLRVEALVECRDPDGDPTRAVGMLWVQASQGDSMRAVEADLSAMDTNAAVWDDVLRVYRLRLELPATACTEGGALPMEARLRLADGRVIQAKATVVCP